ncbi:hypothetical protein [Dapis sp. BLCC M126]|uniref:hypothetical protein n=1 Tax=Dapis sp. BLCC M126 TaxID=3400189 RepID=UPI003CF9F7E2
MIELRSAYATKKYMVCSWALALSTVRAEAQLQALIITIQPDMILVITVIIFQLLITPNFFILSPDS